MRTFLYVGAFTGQPPHTSGRASGITFFDLDPASGGLTHRQTLADVPNPSFLTLTADGRRLYSVNANLEIDGHEGGALSAFSVDRADGTLTLMNREAAGGAGPCHVCVDSTGQWALTACYHGGCAAVLPIRGDGRLAPAIDVVQFSGTGPHPTAQQGPHAHSINLDPANRFALVCNQGLDKVFIYRFDPERGTIRPNPEQPGPTRAPRPVRATWPFIRTAPYVINKQGCSVTVFAFDARRGTLREIQTISTLPAGYSGRNACADIHVHPSGRFVYGSNRGHDSLASFAIDVTTGQLSAIGHQPTLGRTPRNFLIEPTGARLLVANQDSDAIVAFAVDQETGQLTRQGTLAEVPTPTCLALASPLR